MDIKNLINLNKESILKENMRISALKDSITAEAFRVASHKLASYFGSITLDSPESNLTEFSRDKLSGKMSATLTISTEAGLKRVPVHFVIKASVPTMVETPAQIKSTIDNTKGTLDIEAEEVVEKQNQLLKNSEEEINIANEIEASINNGMSKEAAYNKFMYGIDKEAKKKKEFDLGVRENTSASQFPVKELVYSKLYLPEMKKGDTINIGGLKYEYVGDEALVSEEAGGTNGVNARFRLVCDTKKSSIKPIINKKAKLGFDAKPENEKEELVLTISGEISRASFRASDHYNLRWWSTEDEHLKVIEMVKEAIKPIVEKYRTELQDEEICNMLYAHNEDLNLHNENIALKELLNKKEASKKVTAETKDYAKDFNNFLESLDNEFEDKMVKHIEFEDILLSISELEKALEEEKDLNEEEGKEENKKEITSNVENCAFWYALYGKKGQSFGEFLKDYDIDASEETINLVDSYIKEKNIEPKYSK